MGMHAGGHQQHMGMHAGDHQQHMRMHAGDDLLVSAGGMPLSLATRSTCRARLKAACGNDAPCGPAVLVTWRHAIVSGDEICMQSPAEGGHKLCIRPAKDAPAVSGRVAACDGDARLGEGRRDAILRSSLCNVREQQEAAEAARCDAESVLHVTPRCSTGRGAA